MPIAKELDQITTDPQLIYCLNPIELLDTSVYPFLHQVLMVGAIQTEDHVLSYVSKSPRLEFNDAQELSCPQETIDIEQAIINRRQQLISHFMEKGLNAHITYSRFYEYNGRMYSPYSEHPVPFTKQLLIDLIKETSQYLHAKFGHVPNAEEIAWLDEHFEEVSDLLYSQEFMQTRQGLELSELKGVRQLEQRLIYGNTGDISIIFSPYSPLRATQIPFNVLMIGELKEEQGQRVMHMSYPRNYQSLLDFASQYIHIAGTQPEALIAQSIVNKAISIIGMSRTQLFTLLEVHEEPELYTLLESAVLAFLPQINQLVLDLLSGNLTLKQAMDRRQSLEIAIIARHKQMTTSYRHTHIINAIQDTLFHQIQDGYGRGGSCGLVLELVSQNSELQYSFEYKSGTCCRKCHQYNKPLGPCDVCSECQQNYDAGIYI